MIKRNEFFDKLDDDWRVDFSEIAGCSSSKNNVISIPVKEQQVGVRIWIYEACSISVHTISTLLSGSVYGQLNRYSVCEFQVSTGLCLDICYVSVFSGSSSIILMGIVHDFMIVCKMVEVVAQAFSAVAQ